MVVSHLDTCRRFGIVRGNENIVAAVLVVIETAKRKLMVRNAVDDIQSSKCKDKRSVQDLHDGFAFVFKFVGTVAS
jgi:hypothetical protein